MWLHENTLKVSKIKQRVITTSNETQPYLVEQNFLRKLLKKFFKLKKAKIIDAEIF